MNALGPALIRQYLNRLGVSARPEPTLESLRVLHQRHVERVAYENLEIQLGRTTTVQPTESACRIVSGTGGYCFHLNGAFAALLLSLGYDVAIHRGQVKKTERPPFGVEFTNHLALTVNIAGRHWFIDVGLGDALHSPVPLKIGSFQQGPFTFSLLRRRGGWRFHHDIYGSFNVMDWEDRHATLADFADPHTELSTAPDSPFVRRLIIMRRCACQIDVLVDN